MVVTGAEVYAERVKYGCSSYILATQWMLATQLKGNRASSRYPRLRCVGGTNVGLSHYFPL